jgi:hypothetical protein
MPEFQMDLGNMERHAAFDALPDIARGYLEAAFFTGVSASGLDGESLEIDGLGLGNLDAESFDAMAAQAVRFWIANADALAQATESGDYDMDRAGNDFWYTRNGHGVGFWDRDLGDAGDALTSAAQHREIELFAEPIDLGNADPDDSEGWTVSLDRRVDPLTGTERAQLAALEGEPVPAPLSIAASRFGASLGRSGDALDRDAGNMAARRVTLDPGGYDSGGAYWGIGEPLWRVFDADGGQAFFRATNKGGAMAQARKGFAHAI